MLTFSRQTYLFGSNREKILLSQSSGGGGDVFSPETVSMFSSCRSGQVGQQGGE